MVSSIITVHFYCKKNKSNAKKKQLDVEVSGVKLDEEEEEEEILIVLLRVFSLFISL